MVIKNKLCLFVCLCKDFINTCIPITNVVTIISLQTYLRPCQLPFVAMGELYIFVFIYLLKRVNIFFISSNLPFLLKKTIIYLYIFLLKLMDISPLIILFIYFYYYLPWNFSFRTCGHPPPQLILPFSFCKPNLLFAKLLHLSNG
jgi:hypothetical protein